MYDAETNLHMVHYAGGERRWENLCDPSRRPDWLDVPKWVLDRDGRLEFSSADVGKRIRMNWPTMMKWYKGSIKEYSDTPRADGRFGHRIVYDDGDVRWYPRDKMETREYELYRREQCKEPEEEAELLAGWDRDVPTPTPGYPPNSPWLPPAQPRIEENWAFRPTPMTYSMSLFLLDMINSFGNQGGFDALLLRISDTDNPVPIGVLMTILRIFRDVGRHLVRERYAQLLVRLREAVFGRLKGVTQGEIKALPKGTVPGVLALLDALLVKSAEDPTEARLAIDKLRLDLALVLLCSSSLEKRIAGLSDIRAAVERADRIRLMGSESSTLWPQPEWMAQWIVESKLVEILFGPSLHLELVKRRCDWLSLARACTLA